MKYSERPADQDTGYHCVGYFLDDQLIYVYPLDKKPSLIDYMAFDAAMQQHEDPNISKNFPHMTTKYFTRDQMDDTM